MGRHIKSRWRAATFTRGLTVFAPAAGLLMCVVMAGCGGPYFIEPGASVPFATFEFKRAYHETLPGNDPDDGSHTYQAYGFADDFECKNPRVAVNDNREVSRIRVPAGQQIHLIAQVSFMWDVNLSSAYGCKHVAEFVPQQGHVYSVVEVMKYVAEPGPDRDVRQCSLDLSDTVTNAPPPDLATRELALRDFRRFDAPCPIDAVATP